MSVQVQVQVQVQVHGFMFMFMFIFVFVFIFIIVSSISHLQVLLQVCPMVLSSPWPACCVMLKISPPSYSPTPTRNVGRE